MKKKGPQRSQSLKALPGSSLYGLGNTTNFKLLTILDRSRLTVPQTGSVRVLGSGPNPVAEIPPPVEEGGGRGGTVDAGLTVAGKGAEGGGRLEGIKGEGVEEDDTGIDARGGDGARAGRTVDGAV